MAGLVQLLPQDLIDEIKNKVIELFDKTLQEQASVFTDKLAGEVAKNMEPIFKGPGVQKAAEIKFGEYVGPVYDRVMKDHITVVSKLNEEKQKLQDELNTLKTQLQQNPGNSNTFFNDFMSKVSNLFPPFNQKKGGAPDNTIIGGQANSQESFITNPNVSSGEIVKGIQDNRAKIIAGYEDQIKGLEAKQAEQDKQRVEQSHFGCSKLTGGKKTKNKHKRKPKQRKTRRV